MGEWKNTDLGELPDHWEVVAFESLLKDGFLSYGVVQPGHEVADGIPMIRVNNITNGKVALDQVLRIEPSRERLHAKSRLVGDELLISVVGSLGDTVLCDETVKGYNVARAIAVARFESDADRRWVSYALKIPEVKASIASFANTTVQPTLNLKELRGIPIPLPPPEERVAIATVLSSLDAKIDLLHRQNKTLEAMAEALFRQWFVEEAEEGWEEVDVYSLINVTYGFPFKSQYFNEDGRGLPLIRIRDLKDGASNVYTDEPCDDKFVLQCGDLVAGMDGEFRLYIWSGSKAVLNQRACKFTPAHEYVPYMYVLNLMRPHLHYYENTKVGTTVIHLGKSDIDEIRVALPPKDLLLKYGAATDPMHKKIINNHTQLRSLTALRDTLLPKLMSGEVRVDHGHTTL